MERLYFLRLLSGAPIRDSHRTMLWLFSANSVPRWWSFFGCGRRPRRVLRVEALMAQRTRRGLFWLRRPTCAVLVSAIFFAARKVFARESLLLQALESRLRPQATLRYPSKRTLCATWQSHATSIADEPSESSLNTRRLLVGGVKTAGSLARFQSAVILFSGKGVRSQCGRLSTQHSF